MLLNRSLQIAEKNVLLWSQVQTLRQSTLSNMKQISEEEEKPFIFVVFKYLFSEAGCKNGCGRAEQRLPPHHLICRYFM